MMQVKASPSLPDAAAKVQQCRLQAVAAWPRKVTRLSHACQGKQRTVLVQANANNRLAKRQSGTAAFSTQGTTGSTYVSETHELSLVIVAKDNRLCVSLVDGNGNRSEPSEPS